MERHHSVWNSIAAALKIAAPLFKAIETGNEDQFAKALVSAIQNWDHITYGIEKVSNQISSLGELLNHNKHEIFTGTWKASDSKKFDYLIQNGNDIIYYPYSEKGYGSSIYIGKIISQHRSLLHNNKFSERFL